MRTSSLYGWSLVAAAGLVLLASNNVRAQTTGPTPSNSTTNQITDASSDATNIPTPGVVEAKLADAPATLVVPTGPAVPPGIKPDSAVAGVAKLAASGVDESVILVYVTNSTARFDLGPDEIVYLNDVGVSGDVITAMLAHDHNTSDAAANSAEAAPPMTNLPPVMAADYSTNDLAQTQATPPPDMLPEQVQPPPDQSMDGSADVPNPAADYFYDSLAPYGNWVNLGGYGLCWQPTVVVVNSGWCPYVHHGHWTYSDCGWYWASDYTWGWAPFHYGRWFHHNQLGWCWAPDTVWGPAWVGWRHTDSVCGWAPLPPTACYTPRLGFTYLGHPVGTGFNFFVGGPSAFTFVSVNHLTDHHLPTHRIPVDKAAPFFANSTLSTRMLDGRSGPINTGMPVNQVAAAMHAPVTRVAIQDTASSGISRGDFLDRDGRNMLVYRPNLPQPTLARHTFVGTGVKPAPTGVRTTAAPHVSPVSHGRPIAVSEPPRMYRFTAATPPHPIAVPAVAEVSASSVTPSSAGQNAHFASISAGAPAAASGHATPTSKPFVIIGAPETAPVAAGAGQSHAPGTATQQQKVIPYMIMRGAPHTETAASAQTGTSATPHATEPAPATTPNTTDQQKAVVARYTSGPTQPVVSQAPVQNIQSAPRTQMPSTWYYQMPAGQPAQTYSTPANQPAPYRAAPAYNNAAPAYNPAPNYNAGAAYSARQAPAPAPAPVQVPRAPAVTYSAPVYSAPVYSAPAYSPGFSSQGMTAGHR